MTNKTTEDLDPADDLTGGELLHIVQNGNSRVTTLQDVADLAGDAGGIPEAPEDGSLYARKDGEWESFVPGEGGGGGSGSERISARYWRIANGYWPSVAQWVGFGEIEWLDELGANLVGSGAGFASSENGGWGASLAFNGSTSGNGWLPAQYMARTAWIAYDFVTPVEPRQVKLAPNDSFTDMPPIAAIQFSHNAVDWFTTNILTITTPGTADVFQTFNVEEYTGESASAGGGSGSAILNTCARAYLTEGNFNTNDGNSAIDLDNVDYDPQNWWDTNGFVPPMGVYLVNVRIMAASNDATFHNAGVYIDSTFRPLGNRSNDYEGTVSGSGVIYVDGTQKIKPGYTRRNNSHGYGGQNNTYIEIVRLPTSATVERPFVAGWKTTRVETAGTSFNFTIPSVRAGDLILLTASGVSGATLDGPEDDGFTLLHNDSNGQGVWFHWYKIADGTESGDTVVVTSSATTRQTGSVIVVRGQAPGSYPFSSVVTNRSDGNTGTHVVPSVNMLEGELMLSFPGGSWGGNWQYTALNLSEITKIIDLPNNGGNGQGSMFAVGMYSAPNDLTLGTQNWTPASQNAYCSLGIVISKA